MIEVEINNFQAIEHIALGINGFTALVGRSNIGKSAVIRAIKCALTGAAGTDFVRHGSECERLLKSNKKCNCKSTVRFKTSEIELVWEKGDNDNQYVVTKPGEDPVTYTKVDRGTPDFLLPEFKQVQIGRTTDLIQVSDQFEPIFLLKESGGTIADVLADVAKLDDINVAMRLVAKDRKDAGSTRNVRDKDIKDLGEELKSYEGLDDAVQQAKKVTDKYDGIQVMEQKVKTLTKFTDELRASATSVKALMKVGKLKLPDGDALKATGKAFVQLIAFTDELRAKEPVVAKLEVIEAAKLPDGDALKATGKAFVQLIAFTEELGAKEPIVTKLEGVEGVKLPDGEALQTVWDAAERFDGWVTRLQPLKVGMVQYKALEKMPEPDAQAAQEALQALQTVDGLVGGYERLTAAVDELETRLTAVETEEQEALDGFEALGVCPTCSLPLHPERREGAA